MCERLERGRVVPRELDDARTARAGYGARARGRRRLSRQQARAKRVPELPPTGLGVFRSIPRRGALVAPARDPRHRLDRGQHGVGLDRVIGLRARVLEKRPKPAEPLELGVNPRAVGTEDVAERSAVVLEELADLGEREADVAQRPNSVEAPQILLVVDALVPLRARGRHEQPEALVVVQRAHRQTGRARKLSDTPAPSARGSFVHRASRYDLTQRQVQGECARGAPARGSHDSSMRRSRS